MRVAFIITMYDEQEVVLNSIAAIKREFGDRSDIFIIHSDDGRPANTNNALISLCTEYTKMPNLADVVPSHKLASSAVCRNLSAGFASVYRRMDAGLKYDLLVGMTADTLVTDAAGFRRRFEEMMQGEFVAMVSQAVGQKFHASNDDPENGRCCNRPQTELTTDFACCLFLVEAAFANKTKVFENIPITNPFTSEQCLGDELLRAIHMQDSAIFHKYVRRLNAINPSNSYAYNDGIRYHVKNNGKPGR